MKNLFNLIFVGLILLIFVLACTISSPFQQSPTATPTAPAPTVAPSPVAGDESEKLKEKLEELEKKVEAQKQKTLPPVKQNVPIIKGSGTIARVSSPNDGFLALRSDPSSDYGDRILQIPHGATVKILGCQGFREKVGGRSGRWCRVSYAGYTGWVFDGWLVY
ncbi:MAG: SH3 domain-containing protein [Acidobacteriota bacterium]